MTNHLRSAIAAALESLESGDVREATAILLAAIDGGPRQSTYRCPACAFECEWPGERADHVALHHPEEVAA